jgi:hypothetical protein
MQLPEETLTVPPFSRRSFLGAAGLTSAALLTATGSLTAKISSPRAPRQAIVVWLEGGLSQIDSWDPKPFAAGRQFAPIETSVPGLWLSELFPNVAKQMHHLTVVRSFVAASQDHDSAVLSLESSVASAANAWALPEVTETFPLARVVLDGGRSSRPTRLHTLASRQLKADAAVTWDRYGDNEFGRSARLAARLVEQGTRLVEIRRGGFDTHTCNEVTLRAQAEVVDPALAALIVDLDERNLLAETAVLVLTEFGRTPHANAMGGRDHWSAAGSLLTSRSLWGAAAPTVIGQTDDSGGDVLVDPLSAQSVTQLLTSA